MVTRREHQRPRPKRLRAARRSQRDRDRHHGGTRRPHGPRVLGRSTTAGWADGAGGRTRTGWMAAGHGAAHCAAARAGEGQQRRSTRERERRQKQASQDPSPRHNSAPDDRMLSRLAMDNPLSPDIQTDARGSSPSGYPSSARQVDLQAAVFRKACSRATEPSWLSSGARRLRGSYAYSALPPSDDQGRVQQRDVRREPPVKRESLREGAVVQACYLNLWRGRRGCSRARVPADSSRLGGRTAGYFSSNLVSSLSRVP